ncbi:adenylate/guanylate cyclase, partial [Cyanobium sp. T1B-Tous]|nr:adenylate/guanylate cyclase [Cyanobium sp. T1B-Tous]
MVASSLPVAVNTHAALIADLALAMQDETILINKLPSRTLSIRIGINSGPVVAGVIGQKKFIYDLWGEAVNVASRM